MKNFTLSDILFYAMDGLNATYVVMRMELDEPVVKEAMEQAFERTCKRFPYFQTKLQRKDGRFVLIANENKPVMHQDPLEYVINASENDGFLYRFSVQEKVISFSFFHGVTDGVGCIAFFKVLLVEYYRLLGEAVVPPEGVFSLEDVPSPEETDNPLEAVPEDVIPEQDYGDKCFHVPEKRAETGKSAAYNTSYTFSANGKKIMEHAAALGGTPNSLSAIILAKAITDVHAEAAQEGIDIDITINAKPFVGKAKSHWPFLETSTFHFDEQKIREDEKVLHQEVRKKLAEDCQMDKLYASLAGVRIVGDLFDYIPDERARKLLCLKSTETQRATATVSYAGQTDFGGIGKHIKGFYSFCETAAPILEINYNEGIFYFAISCRNDGKAYAEKIRDYFKQLDADCSELQSVRFQLSQGKKDKPKLGLNLATLHLISGMNAFKKAMKARMKK